MRFARPALVCIFGGFPSVQRSVRQNQTLPNFAGGAAVLLHLVEHFAAANVARTDAKVRNDNSLRQPLRFIVALASHGSTAVGILSPAPCPCRPSLVLAVLPR